MPKNTNNAVWNDGHRPKQGERRTVGILVLLMDIRVFDFHLVLKLQQLIAYVPRDQLFF